MPYLYTPDEPVKYMITAHFRLTMVIVHGNSVIQLVVERSTLLEETYPVQISSLELLTFAMQKQTDSTYFYIFAGSF